MSNNWDDPAEMLSRAQAARTQGDRALAYQLDARASELTPQDAQAWQGRAETATSTETPLVELTPTETATSVPPPPGEFPTPTPASP